jgi:hypothetical protein
VRPDTKRCPECGEDFLHTATVCSDCGVPLRLAAELAGSPAGAGQELAGELVLLRAEGPAWIEALAERLRAADIPSRVEIIDPERFKARSGVSGTACGLFVRPADLARARAVDAAVQREQIPDLPEEAGEGESEGCPACGAAVAPEASECPDCGLFLGA